MITYVESGDDSTERSQHHDSYNILHSRCEEIHWLTLLQANLTTGGLGGMGANISLLTGRQHLHSHPDRNHNQGLSRTLQRLRTSAAVCTLPFAREICNLLTLCTARALRLGSSCRLPDASLEDGEVTWRASASALTRSSAFSANTEDWRSCNVTTDAAPLSELQTSGRWRT
ncbi:hypothetical protein Q7P35_006113 [Cladosporium inversicolor]